MKSMHGGRPARGLACLAGVALLLSGVAVAPPAAQAAVITSISASTWAYTDSRERHASYIDTAGDAPIGSWRDAQGKHHKSRAYFTFDISALHGKQIVSANTVFKETWASDCSRERDWELWRTRDITPTTSWANAPRRLRKVADIDGSTCPSSYIGVDLRSAVAEAVAAGSNTITFGLQVPDDAEGNPHLGRRIRHNPTISLSVNTDPFVPTNLTVDGKWCDGTSPVIITTVNPVFNVSIDDPDSGGAVVQPVTATFAVWATSNPNERLEWTTHESYAPTTFSFPLPAGYAQNGGSYAVAVKASDDQSSSAWTPECRFTIDTIRPDRPPTVTSADYPSDGSFHGGVGIPGQFTFSANGVSEVIGFRYGFGEPTEYVAADSPGGSATVAITPTLDGPRTLVVQSVDRAGPRSDRTSYFFYVNRTAPFVEDANAGAWIGEPHLLTFRPRLANVVSYTYHVDDEADQTLPANADGTAQITVTPRPQGSTVYLRSVTGSGLISQQTWFSIAVDTRPFITSADFPFDGYPGVPAGTPGTFVFTPHMNGVVDYVFQFNRHQEDQQPMQVVAAGADGSATVVRIATHIGLNSLHVYSRTSDGTRSAEREVVFHPRSIAPVVTSTAYPDGEVAGGVGVTGSFTFQPVGANVVAYLYQFGNEAEQTVTADAGASATIEWTPQSFDEETGGYVQLLVRSRDVNGYISDTRYYSVLVDGKAPTVTSTVFNYPDGATVGVPAEFTFTANLPGSTMFVYQFVGEPEHTIAVGETLTWTPTQSGSQDLIVRSVTAVGSSSAAAYVFFWVNG